MSSERFEYAEDELEGVLERLGSALTQLGNTSCQSLNNKQVKEKLEKETNRIKKKKEEYGYYEIKEAKIVQICEKSLEDGSKLLEEMDSEARSAPLQYRAQMIATVRALESRLQLLRSSHRSILSGSKSARTSATGGSGKQQQQAGDGVREKVISGIRTLERTGDSLFRSQQVAIETEQVGTGIIEDLGTQRESLERTRNRLVHTETELDETRSVLRKMTWNVLTSKITLIAIIFIEIGILVAVVYWKYFRKTS